MRPRPPPALRGGTLPLPRHVIWDWNGTLLDDTQACVNAINALLLERGLATTDRARYREVFGFPVSAYYSHLGFQMDREDWDALAQRFHDLYLADDTVRLRPEAADVLTWFHAAGVRQSMLSACEQGILDGMLARHRLRHYFDHVQGSDNLHGRSKSAAGHALLARLAESPDHILLVGDTLHDHEVAAALGCRCILVSSGHQTHDRLLASGCQVIASLASLPELLSPRQPDTTPDDPARVDD